MVIITTAELLLESNSSLCQHMPAPRMHRTRRYGTEANRTRGARGRRMAGAGKKPASPRSEPDTLAPTRRERRQQWARLIAKVFEADPLRCPCGGAMRVIAFILEPAVIREILPDRPRPEPRAQAPPPG